MAEDVTGIVEAATRLARALDAEDYVAARRVLDEQCAYTGGPDGDIIGAEAILASYRAHGKEGNTIFDEIIFKSEVRALDEHQAVITYLDRVRIGEHWHDYRCRQQIRIDQHGCVVAIRHEDLPGEGEAIKAFVAKHRPREP
jgi:hypothetical protein